MQSLNEMLSESKIFANREVLSPHFIPKKLISRVKGDQFNRTRTCPITKRGERKKSVYIWKDRNRQNLMYKICS